VGAGEKREKKPFHGKGKKKKRYLKQERVQNIREKVTLSPKGGKREEGGKVAKRENRRRFSGGVLKKGNNVGETRGGVSLWRKGGQNNSYILDWKDGDSSLRWGVNHKREGEGEGGAQQEGRGKKDKIHLPLKKGAVIFSFVINF